MLELVYPASFQFLIGCNFIVRSCKITSLVRGLTKYKINNNMRRKKQNKVREIYKSFMMQGTPT